MKQTKDVFLLNVLLTLPGCGGHQPSIGKIYSHSGLLTRFRCTHLGHVPNACIAFGLIQFVFH